MEELVQRGIEGSYNDFVDRVIDNNFVNGRAFMDWFERMNYSIDDINMATTLMMIDAMDIDNFNYHDDVGNPNGFLCYYAYYFAREYTPAYQERYNEFVETMKTIVETMKTKAEDAKLMDAYLDELEKLITPEDLENNKRRNTIRKYLRAFDDLLEPEDRQFPENCPTCVICLDKRCVRVVCQHCNCCFICDGCYRKLPSGTCPMCRNQMLGMHRYGRVEGCPMKMFINRLRLLYELEHKLTNQTNLYDLYELIYEDIRDRII